MHHCVLSQRPVIMEQRSVLPSGSPQGNREAGRPASARVYRVQKLSDTRRRGGMQKREDESLPSFYVTRAEYNGLVLVRDHKRRIGIDMLSHREFLHLAETRLAEPPPIFRKRKCIALLGVHKHVKGEKQGPFRVGAIIIVDYIRNDDSPF